MTKTGILRRHQCHIQQSSPTLYRMCIRIVSRNIDYYNGHFDLSQLPVTIKTDLIQLNMKLFSGFANEQSFIRLLTSNIRRLMFNSSILTDAMLECIAKQCRNLQELLISTKTIDFTQIGLCKSIDAMHNLRLLQIAGADQMNDRVIETISMKCRRLKKLWINDCANVTDACGDALKSMPLVELNLANTKITNRLLIHLKDSILMANLRDICLRNCRVTKDGLKWLNWDHLENINIMGALIDDLSFIPSTAVYKTLNWSI